MFYKLLAAFSLGVIAGIFLWEKWGVGDEYRAYISKIKNKGTNTALDVVFKPVVGSSGESNSKPQSDKKAARIARKNERKKNRSLKRLNNN